MPPIPSVWQWHSLIARHAKSLKSAATKAARALDVQLSGQPQSKLQTVLVRNTPKQPLHPLARIRQTQSRSLSTARNSLNGTVRTFTSSATGWTGSKFDRASLPKSAVSSHISQSSGRAPFASTLRPNLTGGTLGRTAGGYSLGSGRVGGARHFSHGPASQAQVVQNVSQAVRAFFISGQKAQFDGISSRGEKRYKPVTSLQDESGRKMRSLPKATPGSRLEFPINPTITALTPLNALTGYNSTEEDSADHLNTSGLLDVLSVDFSRALKDLAAILNDLKRLTALGDLPITYEASAIRVHFPGCDAETVDRLCDELSVSRGAVIQDPAFDAFAGTEIALLFPFAPSDADVSDSSSLFEEAAAPPPPAKQVLSLDDIFTPSYSTQSDPGLDVLSMDETPYQLPSPSGYESVRSSDKYEDPLEYQGFEGIYRFLEDLEAVEGRRR